MKVESVWKSWLPCYLLGEAPLHPNHAEGGRGIAGEGRGKGNAYPVGVRTRRLWIEQVILRVDVARVEQLVVLIPQLPAADHEALHVVQVAQAARDLDVRGIVETRTPEDEDSILSAFSPCYISPSGLGGGDEGSGRWRGRHDGRTLWTASFISDSVSSVMLAQSTPLISAAKVGCSGWAVKFLNSGSLPVILSGSSKLRSVIFGFVASRRFGHVASDVGVSKCFSDIDELRAPKRQMKNSARHEGNHGYISLPGSPASSALIPRADRGTRHANPTSLSRIQHGTAANIRIPAWRCGSLGTCGAQFLTAALGRLRGRPRTICRLRPHALGPPL